ncbi:hypothetical protein LTR36_005280 [Oleoguttula mirabilis]|uniref:Homeobox domain-containing protein n=1 Tax=Oleoguttula mirabilis TaxID=1507867 RepID=A0AAV9JGK3_9PEZI|nr:hypothetical protein LTR36_005280 [Oleoguttula mirabilis]
MREMDGFVDYSGQAGYQNTAEDEQPQPQFPHTSSSSAVDAQKSALFNHHNLSCDIKPRLTKEQHDVLEGHFQKNPKPNTATKKGFADALRVSLDKVNNWFQNRRAKSKQDAKKAHGTYNVHVQQQANHGGFSSDSETSPVYPTSDYFNMMQSYTAEEAVPEGLGVSQMQKHQDQGHFVGLPYDDSLSGAEQYHNFEMPAQVPQNMFDSPLELNRRTLTQEQFDAFAQTGTTLNQSENYGIAQTGFTGSGNILNQLFSVTGEQLSKQPNGFGPQSNVPPPILSHDSSVPSGISTQSTSRFPSAFTTQEQVNISSSSSEWNGSRSSSLHNEEPFLQTSGSAQHQAAAITQWQPGQSVPVDFNALSQEFRHAAEARQFPHQPQAHEQPLAWPADEAFVHRDSSTSMLAQHMRNVGIHTPQPQQQDTFKLPAAPASIAVRRQRPRPAGLQLGAARSQSYSGTAQPGSPGQLQHQSLTSGQSIRRIRSSNVVISGVTQGGRVQKLPGSAQRSPMAWSFTDAMNSPRGLRHVSSQSTNLAPPTPMSPSEFPRPQVSSWQTSGHVSRQPSISETDLEYSVPCAPSASLPPQNFSSPPHTPMYYQQNFAQQRVAHNVVMENTPPQSAPASQQCFSANAFPPPQPQMQPPAPQSQAQMHPLQMQACAPPHQQQFMSVIVPDQHFQVPNTTFAPSQQFMIPTTNAPAGVPMQFPHGFPVVNEQGVLQMMYPPQMEFVQHAPPQSQSQPPSQPQQTTHTPPQGQYGMFTTSGLTPGIQVTSMLPRQPSPQPPAEFFVHEYSPPQSLKRAATPRKDVVDTGPKNYTFANQTPHHFEKGKKSADAKASATSSNSPASPRS